MLGISREDKLDRYAGDKLDRYAGDKQGEVGSVSWG